MEDQMTDGQFRIVLKMILMIVEDSETIEEAKEKIKALLED